MSPASGRDNRRPAPRRRADVGRASAHTGRDDARAVSGRRAGAGGGAAGRDAPRAGAEGGKAGAGEVIAGKQAVLAALQAGRALHRIMIAEGVAASGIVSLARERGVPVQVTPRQVLNARAGGLRHQGVLAVGAALSYRSLEDLLAAIPAGCPALLVALAGVEDAGNLGAICRSAGCFGAHGVIVPARRSAGLTAGAVRAAAGALEWLPVARVVNLARTLGEVKERGLWVVGAEADGENLPWEVDLGGPLVLVLGGEERGLGHGVRRACDLVVRIPISGRVPSLNVAAAAAVLLYEINCQRGSSLRPSGTSEGPAGTRPGTRGCPPA